VSARFLARRLLGVIPTLLSVFVLTFALVHALPGDPAQTLAGEGADPARVEELRQQYGFDRPLPAQFVTYVSKVSRGELGVSTAFGKPVTNVIAERIGPTLLLTITALAFSTVVGLLLGILAARRPFGRVDFMMTAGSLAGYAIPAFWLAQLSILAFALRLKVFPLGGYENVRHPYTGLDHAADVAYHLILPALVLAVSEVALLARVTRTGLLQEMGRDYIRTARAKGVPEDQVLAHHALRSALLPVVTIVGTRIGFLVSGAVVIEAVYNWPGLGSVLVAAAASSDREMMLGLVLVVAFGVIVANLVTDIVYGFIDPRVRVR